MLKTISAALIATSLIAAPALAANSGTTVGTATQTQAQPKADATAQAAKPAKMTSTKGKKLHTSTKTIRHHNKKISMHKTHATVASKVPSKPALTATKRS